MQTVLETTLRASCI